MTIPGVPSTASPEPSGRRSIQAQARSKAPVAEVWPLIGEAHRWKDWSFLTRSELERVGDQVPDGVGAVRRFTRYGVGSREEVVGWDPPRHLAYTILAGLPVRHYRADVILTPEGDGTRISWSATFDEKIPATGRLMVVALEKTIARFAKSVALYADQHRGQGT
jgi:hypothetical protein